MNFATSSIRTTQRTFIGSWPSTCQILSFKVTCLSSGVITPHEKCRAEIVKNGEVISSRLLDDGRYSTSDFDYENTEEIDIFVYPGYSNELLTGGYGLNPKKNPTWYVNSIDLLETNKEEGEMGHFHLGTCPNDNK